MITAIRCKHSVYATLPELVDFLPEEPAYHGKCSSPRTHYCARTPDERTLWAINALHAPWVSGLDVRPAAEPGRVLVTATSYSVPCADSIILSVSAATLALAGLHSNAW